MFETFRTRSGSLVMPFGLKNTPAAFQCIMEEVLGDMKNVKVYVHDILV